MKKALNISKILVLGFVLIMGFNSCKDTTTNPVDASKFEGIVTDNTDNPVPNAVVDAFIGNTYIVSDTTDESGNFSLSGLPTNPDKVYIRITSNGFKQIWQELKKFLDDQKFGADRRIRIYRGDSCQSYVSIIVKDSVSGNGLSNVSVKISQFNQTISLGKTNDAGIISFGNFCPGEFNLRIYKDGYKVIEQSFVVGEKDTLTKDFLLVKNPEVQCCSQLNVFVKDIKTNSGVPGAEVKLTKSGTDQNTLLKTNDAGYVTFNDVCTGNYWIRISKSGYKVLEQDGIIFQSCDTLNMTFQLSQIQQDTCCNGSLTIYPKDSVTGAVISGAVVKLWKNGQLIKTVTVSNGEPAKFNELCQGTYGVSVAQEHYNEKEKSFEIACNQTKEEPIYLSKIQQDTCCDNKIIIYAKDSTSNAALANATVRLSQNGQTITTKTTDAHGRVAFENLCTGTYTLNITKDGYKNLEIHQEVSCHTSKELTEFLARTPCHTAVLKFQTKDYDSGEILANVKVVISLNGLVIFEGRTNSEGNIVIDGLTAPDVYEATFTTDGYQTRTIEMTFVECNVLTETAKLKKN
jgi:hypothetical protein